LKLVFEFIEEDETRISFLKYIDFCSVSSLPLITNFEMFSLNNYNFEVQKSIWKKVFYNIYILLTIEVNS
jgi:hypothetical protein